MLFLGDLHGSISHILYSLKRMNKDQGTIVQVGDFGIGFNNEETDLKNLSILDEALGIWNKKIYIVRGNHDNPRFFKGEFRDKLNKKFENVYFIEDYEVLEIEGKKIVFIGGGISIDRTHRKEGDTYWKEEAVVFDQYKLDQIMNNNTELDIIVTHSAPNWCFPKGIDAPIVRGYIKVDEDLKQDLIDERETLGVLFDMLNEKYKFKYHFYGHFHQNQREKIVDCDHILIGIGDFIDLSKLEKLKQEEPEKFD